MQNRQHMINWTPDSKFVKHVFTLKPTIDNP